MPSFLREYSSFFPRDEEDAACHFANWLSYVQYQKSGNSGDENLVQVMTGSKIDEYQLFDYEWLYTGIHKIANHAQRAMRDLLERGNFDLYDSQYFDAQVSVLNCIWLCVLKRNQKAHR